MAGGVLAAAGRFPWRAARMLASHRDGDLIEVLFLRHVRAHPDVPEAALVRRTPDAPTDTVPRHLPLAETGEAPAGFYISAPADIVRPHLAKWKAESTWFYLEWPQAIAAKYELDALTPMLRLARRKPVVGAALLMPYLAQEVADLMAEWLTRSPLEQSRTLLGRDPFDIVPAKIPTVPRWADLELLPQVLLPDRRHALPSSAAAALLRMIAMSQLDAPYEGLRVIAGPVRSRQPRRLRLVALPAMGVRGPTPPRTYGR